MVKKQRRMLLMFAVLLFLGIGIASSYAVEKTITWPVEIDVTSPKGWKSNIPYELNQGWPLTIRLSTNGLLGVGMVWYPPEFPLPGMDPGYLMFTNDASCWVEPQADYFTCQNPIPEGEPGYDRDFCKNKYETDVQACLIEETFLRLTPFEGFPAELTYDRNPSITLPHTTAEDQESTILGPLTGPAESGYGFGPSGFLPELVMLADTGAGLVYVNPDPAIGGLPTAKPLEARNLAGFFSSVGYELKDATGKFSIEVHTLVKHGLFNPLVIADLQLGAIPAPEVGQEPFDYPDPDDSRCQRITSQAIKVQIDGGSVQELTSEAALLPILEGKITTVRIFVVNHRNGSYLNTLRDLNNDGRVDVNDARLDGYTPLSEEKQIKFRTRYLVDQIPITLVYDIDGNTCAGGLVLPGGAGGLTPIDR